MVQTRTRQTRDLGVTETPQKANSDSEVSVSSTTSADKSYEELRMANIQRNQEFLRQLGPLPNIAAHPKKHTSVVARGAKRKREAAPAPPPRKSMRAMGLSPEGEEVTRQSILEQQATQRVRDQKARLRVPGPVSAQSFLVGEGEEVEEGEEASSRIRGAVSALKTPAHSPDKPRKGIFPRFAVPEWGAFKLVPERIYSVAWLPSKVSLVGFVGDKWGHLGICRAGDEADFGSITSPDMYVFKAHKNPISYLATHSNFVHSVLSSSYDGSVRRFDAQSEQFVDLFLCAGAAEGKSSTISMFSMSHSGNVLYAVDADGTLHSCDVRAGNTATQELSVHNRKVSSVQVNPTDDNTLVTCSLDQTIKIWDVRKWSSKNLPKPITTLAPHSQSIQIASFSPCGDSLLSQSNDGSICFWHEKTWMSDCEPRRRVKHNNNTGRWVSNFRTEWDPKRTGLCLVGSMDKPRGCDVIDSHQGVVAKLSDPLVTAIPALNTQHPFTDAILSGNASGRVTIWLKK